MHFEVYIRRTPGSPWALELATENRAAATESAQQLMDEGRVAAAKVTKETFDDESREFQTVTILKLGAADAPVKARKQGDAQPMCVTPQDLYTIHARERIARLLEGWLERCRATPFELLHRADLVEKLEATGTELQHAVQKIAVPEAHARGMSTHEMIRVFLALIDRTVDRLLKDHKKGVLPKVSNDNFAATAERLLKEPERGYLLGAGVAAAIADAGSWSDKIDHLLDLADCAPKQGPARALALSTLEQPIAEILESKAGFEDVLGKGNTLGETLAAMTRLAAHQAVDLLIKAEPSVAKVMPPLSPQALRLAQWLAGDGFADVRAALGRRILQELNGPRRLCPGNAEAEIDVLRALAMALTTASGKLLPLEDVQAAFTARSRMLVTGDFVDSYLGQDRPARDEVAALIWLTENVLGAANKRQAGAWLLAVVDSLRFEKDMVFSEDSPAGRLAQLAAFQRDVARSGLAPEAYEPIQARMGELGGQIDARAKVATGLAGAEAPILHRLTLLLRLAAGQSAPLGPAADRARAEAFRLIRQDDARAELARSPEQMNAVRELIQQCGLAA